MYPDARAALWPVEAEALHVLAGAVDTIAEKSRPVIRLPEHQRRLRIERLEKPAELGVLQGVQRVLGLLPPLEDLLAGEAGPQRRPRAPAQLPEVRQDRQVQALHEQHQRLAARSRPLQGETDLLHYVHLVGEAGRCCHLADEGRYAEADLDGDQLTGARVHFGRAALDLAGSRDRGEVLPDAQQELLHEAPGGGPEFMVYA
mmetsp:Transcript_76859/g.248758  ORF Transcript_76859/g.248758 Transcript_76859/m.248758 type:complete len:202 (-) Transcript_76859:17-622(-)